MTTLKQIKGQRAELAARHYLESQGLRFVKNNYTCRSGEIDLIMRDNEALVFIEVRFRRQAGYGSSIETVRPSKQRRIIRSALHYLQQKDLYDQIDCRFDVVGLDTTDNIVWIKDAFQVQY